MKEIIAGPSNSTGEIQILCLIRDGIEPRTYLNNQNEVVKVISTSSDTLPEWALDLVSLDDIDKLDNGSIAFKITGFKLDINLSHADILARIREVYNAAKITFILEYEQKYHQFYGVSVDSGG